MPISRIRARTIVLVAHGSHNNGQLSARGVHQVSSLLDGLDRMDVKPHVILTSRRDQALSTAEPIGEKFHCPLMRLHELTPSSGSTGTIHDIFEEYEHNRARQDHLPPLMVPDHPFLERTSKTVVIVGHEGRLSNLITELTTMRTRPLLNGEFVILSQEAWGDFDKGAGVVAGRWPIAAHGEAELRDKLNTKIVVATVLAGFLSAALVEIGVAQDGGNRPLTMLSVGALTSALGLLLAAIFIYDQLSMPEGFWSDGPRPVWLRRLNSYKQRRLDERWSEAPVDLTAEQVDDSTPFSSFRLDGPVHTHMVATHRSVFTPGVMTGVLGVGLAVAAQRWWLVVPFVLAVSLSGGWYFVRRPTLGVD